jgi:hypothetical protein
VPDRIKSISIGSPGVESAAQAGSYFGEVAFARDDQRAIRHRLSAAIIFGPIQRFDTLQLFQQGVRVAELGEGQRLAQQSLPLRFGKAVYAQPSLPML